LVHVVKNELTPEDEEVLAGLSLYRDFGGQEKLK
jgi:hypothetical protein